MSAVSTRKWGFEEWSSSLALAHILHKTPHTHTQTFKPPPPKIPEKFGKNYILLLHIANILITIRIY